MVLEGYVEAVDEDEVCDLIAVLQQRVEGVDPAAEEAGYPPCEALLGWLGACLSLHRDRPQALQPPAPVLRAPQAKYLLDPGNGREEPGGELPWQLQAGAGEHGGEEGEWKEEVHLFARLFA